MNKTKPKAKPKSVTKPVKALKKIKTSYTSY